MPNTLAELTEQAKALPPDERARLLDALIVSVYGPAGADVEQAWDEELRRRVDDVERSTAQLLPADTAFAQARAALR